MMSYGPGAIGTGMHIALACRSLAMLGGRERDCLEIAAGLGRRGHRVTLVTTSKRAGHPPHSSTGKFEYAVLADKGRTNHTRVWNFATAVKAWRNSAKVDALIGFDRMFGLDFHYSADQPWPRHRGLKARLPRHRIYLKLERAVFGRASGTHIFFLASPQAENYRKLYDLPSYRYEILPPFIRSDHSLPAAFHASRERVRRQLQIPPNHALLINVALYGHQKGTDRIIEAMPALPGTTLLCVGLQRTRSITSLARRRGIADRVRTIGYTSHVADLIGAADLMVHPARVETTGSVILESLLYGTPVIASGVCGYAEHIRSSGAGAVVDEPFEIGQLQAAIAASLTPPTLEELRNKAQKYARHISATLDMDAVSQAISQTVMRIAHKGHCGGKG